MRKVLFLTILLAAILVFVPHTHGHFITQVVAQVKPSIVGVGLYDAMGIQTYQLRGTGFVFGDGSLIAINYHVVSEELDLQKVQYHIVFSGTGKQPKIHKTVIIAKDRDHDLVILKIDSKLPTNRYPS